MKWNKQTLNKLLPLLLLLRILNNSFAYCITDPAQQLCSWLKYDFNQWSHELPTPILFKGFPISLTRLQ